MIYCNYFNDLSCFLVKLILPKTFFFNIFFFQFFSLIFDALHYEIINGILVKFSIGSWQILRHLLLFLKHKQSKLEMENGDPIHIIATSCKSK